MRIYLMLFGLMISASIFGQGLTMLLTNSEVNGDLLTYDVTAENFDDMVAMQYGIVYDESNLQFVEFQNFNLPGMTASNFNPNNPGEIRALWLDGYLQGVTMGADDVHFQIVFKLIGNTPGDVCYSEDPLIIEFINVEVELTSFSIMDDCHTEPYEINLTVSNTEELADKFGFQAATLIQGNSLAFSIEEPQELAISLFTSSGHLIKQVSNRYYPAGSHTIDISSALPGGMYVLAIEIEEQVFSVKLIK